MPELVVVILTKDEERNIEACIESVAWADQVVVFDCFSTDRTVELARKRGATVMFHEWSNYAAQRDAALAMVEGDWIFFVDADERATEAVAQEVRQVIKRDDVAGWWVPRRNYIWGKWIKHAGWFPDYQLRLLRRGRARYDPTRPVHELVLLDGPEAYLENPLIHYNYRTVGQFLQKQDRYADYEANILLQQGVRPSLHKYISRPLHEFWRRYVTLEGYKDGAHGLLLSLLLAYYTFQVYVRLRRLWKRESPINSRLCSFLMLLILSSR